MANRLHQRVALCGRALAVTPLSAGLFAVTTSVGLAVASTDGGVLRVLDSWRYDPTSSEFIAMGTEPPTECEEIIHQAEGFRSAEHARLATLGPDRLLLSRGTMVQLIDDVLTGAPRVIATEDVGEEIEALRGDRGTSGYASGHWASRGWRFDLAQDALLVTHDDAASAWADRVDCGALSVYFSHAQGAVLLAQVVR